MYIFLKLNKIIVLLKKKKLFYTLLYLEVQTNFIKQIKLARAGNTLFIIVWDTTYTVRTAGRTKTIPAPRPAAPPVRSLVPLPRGNFPILKSGHYKS